MAGISGATVTLHDGTRGKSRITDEEGAFDFGSTYAAQWTLNCTHPNYTFGDVPVILIVDPAGIVAGHVTADKAPGSFTNHGNIRIGVL